MIYQGSKERISKDLLPYIQNCIDDNHFDVYVEPFVGGANMIDKVKCHYRIGIDRNHWVIELLKYMRDNPNLPIAPEDCSFELYAKVRESYNKGNKDYSDVEKAMIGYFASYGGRFYDGGYGRDKTGKRNIYKERVAYAKKQAPLLSDISFIEGSYKETCNALKVLHNSENCLIYCDPPYSNTKQYGVTFNSESFYTWVEELSKKYFVLVSEYSMPSSFVKIWSKEKKSYAEIRQNSCRKSRRRFVYTKRRAVLSVVVQTKRFGEGVKL